MTETLDSANAIKPCSELLIGVIDNVMAQSVEHKRITPSHVWYFRTDSLSPLIIEISLLILHVLDRKSVV